MGNKHNNAPDVPQTVYLVENRTCLLAYASREDADKAVASMPASVGGGFLVSPVQVFEAPAPAQEPVDMVPRAALHEVGLTDDDKQALQVMRWLNSGEWALTRSQPSSYLTDEANAERAWFVERQAIPYCDKNGHRRWFGCTALFVQCCHLAPIKTPCRIDRPLQQIAHR